MARVLYELRRYHWPDGNPPQFHPEKWGTRLSSFLPRYSDAPGAAGEARFQIDAILKDAITEVGNGADAADLEEVQLALISSLAKDYELAGVGTWAAEDEKIIEHYIHGRCANDGKPGAALCANFRLTPGVCKHKVDIHLHRLQPKRDNNNIDEATVRIIRTYQFGKDNFKMISRVDWEPRLNVARETLQSRIAASCCEELTDWLRTRASRGDSLEAVVLDDHLKGFSKRGMIEQVIAEHSKAEWFVRTKDKEVLSDRPPLWFARVNEPGRLKLLAVGPDIASRRFPLERLYTASTSRHLLTRRSYELLTSIRRCSEAKNFVVASDLMELIILAEDGACYGARSPTSVEDADLKKINWTTAFFTCLAHQVLTNGLSDGDKPAEINAQISAAIENAHDHCGVKVPESVYFRCKTVPKVTSKTSPQPVFTLGEWQTLENEWRQATTGLGFIEQSDATDTYSCLQVWRAKTDLPGYIACIEQKRDAIGRIWQAIKSFKMQGGAERPLSILLEADPGIGKTFLANTMAKTVGCQLIHHDVTQMIHRGELLDLFDSVATAQAEAEADVPVMVFVDEINATLDASPVYGAFLSPLEGGFYMRRGTKFRLKPCIWIFARTPGGGVKRGGAGGGSNHQDQGQSDEDNAEKLCDFMSRLDIHEKIGYGETQLSICESSLALKPKDYDAGRLPELLTDYFGIELEVLPGTEVGALQSDACRQTPETAAHLANASRSILARFAHACQHLGREGILSRVKAPAPGFSATDINRVLKSASVLEIWFMFRDRFSNDNEAHPLCDLLQLDADARLEQVYLGAEAIHQRFPDTTSVSKDILEAFYAVVPHASNARNPPARKIRRLVLSLTNVQYGRVGNHNCTASAWKELLEENESVLRRSDDNEGEIAEVWAKREPSYISLDFG